LYFFDVWPSSNRCKENYKDELDFVVNSLKTHDYVAIGEIGIDLYWDKSFLNEQQEAFSFK
jgi:TatD DNase family protein